MALSATVNWEVRTTGNDTNGGGFNAGASGTDYSQQDTAQTSYTDLVIGATNTQLTSAGNPFTSAHVGNLINITGGTGFTAGRYQVNSVSGGVATMDRAVGTAASTGGTGNLGGGLLTHATAFANVQAGNTVWTKNGTYSISATLSPTGSHNVTWIGYNATHGDDGTAPLITQTASSTNLFTINCSIGYFRNLSFSNTAATRAIGFNNSASSQVQFERCSFDGFTTAINAGFPGPAFTYLLVHNCLIKNSTSSGLNFDGNILVSDSLFFNNTGAHLTTASANLIIQVFDCVFAGGGNRGILLSNNGHLFVKIRNCTVVNNGSNGIDVWTASQPAALTLENNIAYGNSGAGISISLASSLASWFLRTNAVGGNAGGSYAGFASAGAGDVALTASPITSTTNFALNSTAGGGAACKGAGWPGAFPGGATTGAIDIGAIQSSSGGGGGGGGLLVNPGLSGGARG